MFHRHPDRSTCYGFLFSWAPLFRFGWVVATWPSPAPAESVRVYVGTYTRGMSEGIYVCELDLETGRLTAPRLAAEARNPSFLAVHPNGRYLAAVNELPGGGRGRGGISSFRIDAASGKLEPIGAVSSRGAGPCHLVIDASGKMILAANYGGGSTVAVPIDPETGRVSEASAFVQHTGRSVHPRQKGPHAHGIALAPDNSAALVADLGLDQLLIYDIDPSRGSLKPHDPPMAELPPASGPRHVVVHPNGKWVYTVNELASTVTRFDYDAKRKTLSRAETVTTLPGDYYGSNTTAEIATTPDGRYLYASNRGHDSLACFAIDKKNGRLKSIGHVSTRGKTPRNFAIEPSGRYLLAANQATNNVVVFAIGADGRLKETGSQIEVGAPVCIVFATKR